MANPTDPRRYWNGLISYTDRRNVLINAGADPAEEDSDWDDLTVDARARLTLLVGGFRAPEPRREPVHALRVQRVHAQRARPAGEPLPQDLRDLDHRDLPVRHRSLLPAVGRSEGDGRCGHAGGKAREKLTPPGGECS